VLDFQHIYRRGAGVMLVWWFQCVLASS